MIWSREEDFRNDFYRPSALIRVQGAVDATGEITDLIYRNVSPSINIQRGQVSSNNPEDTGAVSGAVGLPYRIGARRILYVPLLPCDVRLGYWRSVGESYNTFAVESAIDELALLAGKDPMAYRKDLVSADARALGVLTALETLTNWGAGLGPGLARGMAYLTGYGRISQWRRISPVRAAKSRSRRSIARLIAAQRSTPARLRRRFRAAWPTACPPRCGASRPLCWACRRSRTMTIIA